MSQNTIPEIVVLQQEKAKDESPLRKLSFLDRYLSLWIILAMVIGTLLGVYVPDFRNILNTTQIENVSLPVFIGLLLMLYPVFCKVRYEELHYIAGKKESISYILFSLVTNWIICPLIMAGLAWACLPDLPQFRVGVLMIGIARCIAMVLVWNHLAGGDAEWCAIFVAINSIMQMILFSFYAYLFTVTIGGSSAVAIDMWFVAKNVLIFLGIPFAGGLVTRLLLRFGTRKYEWYDNKLIPFISPLALLGLLYTIFIMFALQGGQMVDQIGPVFRTVVPLVLYFAITWFAAMFACYLLKFPFSVAIPQSFTASSNNFELAMAVAIATFGVDSREALAATVGPLVEVPVLISLVYLVPVVAKYYKVNPQN
ncbi:hypothetical protein HDV06_004973 [Boothiomyces sp. JEL0866]|nr:hypothetical protein HDV06_004940 [Boothiomyces sp. JEL0866]KAJ3325216.1 hypothetical protein HDV06_004973 [Boothiomyces sp. JEL0866]